MSYSIYKECKTAVIILIIFIVITGLIYPFIITEIAQSVFPEKANGSLIVRDGKNLGSALIGQYFDSPKYFWGRPSSAEIFPYNVMGAKGSGISPANPKFIALIENRLELLQKAHKTNSKIPIELVEDSGSGIDPHISPMAAYYQVSRVAKARGLKDAAVRKLVDEHVEDRQFGLLGEPRVNVLQLNLALDNKGKNL
jgi:K+-transporting ATPase ATPase C chain